MGHAITEIADGFTASVAFRRAVEGQLHTGPDRIRARRVQSGVIRADAQPAQHARQKGQPLLHFQLQASDPPTGAHVWQSELAERVRTSSREC